MNERMKRAWQIFSRLAICLVILGSVYNTIYHTGPFVRENAGEEEYEKADNPDQYDLYQQVIRTKEGEKYPAYKMGYVTRELEKAQNNIRNLRTERTEALTWNSLGPGNVSGRTRVALVDAGDANQLTWLAGTAGGGIWKTTDGGNTWQNKTPDVPNLATNALAQCKNSPLIMYAGTGEGYGIGGAIKGDGMYKSSDGGETWQIIAATRGDNRFENVNRIIVDPNNPDVVLVCSNTKLSDSRFFSGIIKTMDGGLTWLTVYEGNAPVQQLIYDPTNFNNQYAAQYATGVAKSTDAGDTWTINSAGLIAGGRVEIAVAPTNPNRIFAATEGNSNQTNGSDIFLSNDGGATWALLKEINNGDNVDWLGGQGIHDNTIVVHPFDENVVYVGGIDLHKMVIQPGSDIGSNRLLNVFENGTQSFLSWINWGGGFLGGGFDTGDIWFSTGNYVGYPIDVTDADKSSVEIRFGPGISQKAHRFVVDPTAGTNGDGGAGVPPEGHHFASYVEVPFQVWDTDHNRQLMVSFRDQQRNGVFNLNSVDSDPTLLTVREYIFISAVTYDPNGPDPNIAKDGGHGYKNIYSMWPRLKDGEIWDPNNLPDSKIDIIYGSLNINYKQTTKMTNSNGTLSQGTVHPDHHDLVPIITTSSTFKFLDTNDGGVYLSNSAAAPGEGDNSWTKVSYQIKSGQFYGMDKKPAENIYLGGLQDNGVWVSGNNPASGSYYGFIIGGDGGEVVWDYGDPSKVIVSNQFNNLFRSINTGASFRTVSGVVDKGSGKAPFVTRIGNSKSTPGVIYVVGKQGVWKSTNFGDTWKLTSITNGWLSGTSLTGGYNVEVSQADPTVVWAGGRMTSTANMFVSTNIGNSFTPVANYTGATMGSISGIATDPYDRNTAYLLFSIARTPKILRTRDMGQTWTDLSGFENSEVSNNGFPDVAVYSLLVLPTDTNTIWAGTEIGIFESNDDGLSWHLLNSNLPSASIWDIKAVDDQVIVATHGRGLWSLQIPGMQWPEKIVTSLQEDVGSGFSIYPNPAIDQIHVKLNMPSQGIVRFDVIDLSGRSISDFAFEIPAGKSEKSLNVSSLHDGIYILNVAGYGFKKSIRFVISR